MYRLYLAIRYLLSRPINLLGVGGILLGVWALIVVPSIFTGYLEKVGEHLQSSTADLTIRDIDASIGWPELERAVTAVPGVGAAAPRLTWQGMLHPERVPERSRAPARGLDELADTPLVTLLGIEPAAEGRVTGLGDWLRAPPADLRVADPAAPFTAPADAAVPIAIPSRQRLERDGLQIGGRAVVTLGRLTRTGGEEALRTEEPIPFRIGGSFESSFAAFDGLHVLVSIDQLRDRLGLAPTTVNEVAVRLAPGADPDDTAARLGRALAEAFPRRPPIARTWREANQMQLGSIDHQRGLLKLVLFVIMIVAAFLVYATLSMMVTEKTRDIGILTAMGGHAGGVVMVFVGCGAAITVVGVVLGVIAGCLSAIWLDPFNQWLRAWFGIDLFPVNIYNLREVPHSLDPVWIAEVAAVSLVLGVVVAALPAWRAARHDPLVSLRNES